MNTIHVKVSKEYDVIIGRNLLSNISNLIMPLCSGRHIGIVTDSVVDNLYGKFVLESLRKNNFSADKYVFQNGEQSKNIDVLSAILSFLAKKNFRRSDVLIALGGGVVGDITGLAASLYMRGIQFIQIPTTLLAMVDASVGGKTAVNLSDGKNLVGTFWQPQMVLCDVNIARDLPNDIFSEGMGEVIKYGLIEKNGIMNLVYNGMVYDNLEKIITECVRIKKNLVEKDEFDLNGYRQLLNAGHTFGHALEKLNGYRMLHGQAVAIGLVWEAGIAYKIGMCNFDFVRLVYECVRKCNLWSEISYKSNDMLMAMCLDKKNRGSDITFVLPKCIGQYSTYKVALNNLCDYIESISKEFKKGMV